MDSSDGFDMFSETRENQNNLLENCDLRTEDRKLIMEQGTEHYSELNKIQNMVKVQKNIYFSFMFSFSSMFIELLEFKCFLNRRHCKIGYNN